MLSLLSGTPAVCETEEDLKLWKEFCLAALQGGTSKSSNDLSAFLDGMVTSYKVRKKDVIAATDRRNAEYAEKKFRLEEERKRKIEEHRDRERMLYLKRKINSQHQLPPQVMEVRGESSDYRSPPVIKDKK